jgi:hypothetical protein
VEGVESRVVPWSPDRLLLLIEAVAELPITRVEPGDLIAPDPAEDHFAAVVPNAIARCSLDILAAVVRSASSVLAVLNEEGVAEKTAREHGLADFRRGAPISSVVGRLDDAGVPGFLNEMSEGLPFVRIMMTANGEVEHSVDRHQPRGFPRSAIPRVDFRPSPKLLHRIHSFAAQVRWCFPDDRMDSQIARARVVETRGIVTHAMKS